MTNSYAAVGYGGMSDGLGVRPAVLVVDMQLAFTDPRFPLGGLPMVHAAVDTIGELLRVAREAHVPVAKCYTAYGSVADMPRWKVPAVREQFIHGHPCTAIDPRLHDETYDFTFCKTAPSIFFLTPLMTFLTKHAGLPAIPGLISRHPARSPPLHSIMAAARGLLLCHCSSPKIATLFGVATKTLPSATTGTTNLLPLPNRSRPFGAWLLL